MFLDLCLADACIDISPTLVVYFDFLSSIKWKTTTLLYERTKKIYNKNNFVVEEINDKKIKKK